MKKFNFDKFVKALDKERTKKVEEHQERKDSDDQNPTRRLVNKQREHIKNRLKFVWRR